MEFKILLQFLRLMGAIALEGLASLFHITLFLLRRRAERERVFALILRKDPGLAAAAAVMLLGALALSPLAGCSSAPSMGEPHPGTSFGKQVEEFRWSMQATLGMEGAQKSLEDDLEAFGSGTSVQDAADDLGTVLIDDGAQKSLEDDLNAFGASEPGALRETLWMLGF